MKRCIIHYDNQTRYTSLKDISSINWKRILDAKNKRCGLGGSLSHEAQRLSIPDNINKGRDCIHLEPCYKR